MTRFLVATPGDLFRKGTTRRIGKGEHDRGDPGSRSAVGTTGTDNPDAVAGLGEDIFADEMTGSSMSRPTWNELMTRARPDGTVVTQKHWSKAMQRKEIIVR